MKNNINDIVTSELIARVNNVKYKQEYGEVGESIKITTSGNSTIFATDYAIDKVIYVTVNGVALIEGKHYDVTSDYTISISNEGSPIKNNPGLTTNILVGYNYKNRKSLTDSIVKVPPVLNSFYIDKYSGKDGKILFDFSIEANDGKNIFWSLLKDGSQDPLYTGTTLVTNNSNVSDGLGGTTELSYYVSVDEYEENEGRSTNFTLLAIYDLSDDGSKLDEQILSTVTYSYEQTAPLSGSLESLPATITTTDSTDIIVTYNINTPEGSPSIFDWKVTRSFNSGAETIVKSGNQASANLSGTYVETVSASEGDNSNIRYSLKVLAINDPAFLTIANDVTNISVATASQLSFAGYLDAAIMSYQNPVDSSWIKIGDLGTDQDRLEYTSRVPREIFTKDVDTSYLSVQKFISAPVNTFGDTVDLVYFVIEVPTAWGPIEFFQDLGKIDGTSFNTINLQNGYTAYLYKQAPSSVVAPSDYYIKSEI